MILLHKNSGQHAGMEKGYSHFIITYGMVRSEKNDLTGKIRKTLHIGNSIPTSYFAKKQKKALGQEKDKGNNHLEKCKLLVCLVPLRFLLLSLAFIAST